MKLRKSCISILFLIMLCFLPTNLYATTDLSGWTAGPWQPQNMISWGDKALVVDFGINGLWNYDGTWIQLSRWNPEGMVVWGKNNLTVDFGTNGLWSFNGSSWKKLTRGDT